MNTRDEYNIADSLGLNELIGLHALFFDCISPITFQHETLPATLKFASYIRQREFLAGRYCARRALSQINGNDSAPSLLVNHDRLPIWPSGWTGSISHSSYGAIAVAATSSQSISIGVDMDRIVDRQIVTEIEKTVGRANEWKLFNFTSPQTRLTILFSAKEALFKALYPMTRRFQNFDAAEAIYVGNQAIHLRLTEDWSNKWVKDTIINVRYAIVKEHVFSIAIISK